MTSKEIDSLTERTLRTFNVPGIAVAVIKDGKVIHSKGYGVRSLNTGKKVDEHTLFGIASNSKAFTAAALGMLVDEGKLNWDDRVRKYIPEFTMYDPYVTDAFTVRDLLTHRSGLGLGAGDLMIFPDSNDFTIQDIIGNLRLLKPVSAFRTKFDYDNNLYIVAGEIVTRITGKSWDEFIEQRIFAPLGMTSSAGSYDRLKDKSDVIDGHAVVNGKVRVIDRDLVRNGHAAGGINTSIADLEKWVLLLLNQGKFEGDNHLFTKAILNEMWTPQTIIPTGNPGPYNTHFSAYGLGFFINDVKGYKQLSHTGGLEGMVTQITLIPELSLGIIVLTNQEDGLAFSAITNQIKDSYLGIRSTDRVKEYAARRAKSNDGNRAITDSVWQMVAANEQVKIAQPDFSTLAGSYKDPWFGEVDISLKDGKKWFESKRAHKLTGQLFFLKGNTYVVKWNDRSLNADAYVNFSLDEAGNGSGMTMKPISPATDFSFDFQDLEFKK